MAPLKLDSMIPDDEYIETGDQKFFLTARISRDLLFEFMDMKDELEGEMTREKLSKTDDFLVKLISSHPKNKEPEVRTFIKGLDLVEFGRVANYVTDYIKLALAESKKKTGSSPSSGSAPKPTGP